MSTRSSPLPGAEARSLRSEALRRWIYCLHPFDGVQQFLQLSEQRVVVRAESRGISGVDNAQTGRKVKQVSCLGCRADSDVDEIKIFPRSSPRASFDNIAGNRYSGATELFLNSEAFIERSASSRVVHSHRERICRTKHFQLARVAAHGSCRQTSKRSAHGESPQPKARSLKPECLSRSPTPEACGQDY